MSITSMSKNAEKVLKSRYLRSDRQGNIIETPDELFQRVASSIAKAELQYGHASEARHWEKRFYDLMAQLLFLPNSPTLMNAGTREGQLSACFVLPIADDMGSIFSTLKLTALIQQSGGGTGFNFSALRPKGSLVRSTGGEASGPVSFMKIYDSATENIKQGGKRRGANMGILNIDHPDIESFIALKNRSETLRNFNISVGVTDDFMKAVEKGHSWPLRDPNTRKVVRTLPARQLWEQLTHHAWQSGDPGVIFLDTINRYNPTPEIGQINCTNPCGEVPLLPYEPCNLGSINLSNLVKGAGKQAHVNWKRLENIIPTAVRFLDNVIEVNHYIHPAIKKMALGNRKIGLGVMGWAEMLIKLGIPYDSEKALQLGKKIMRFIRDKSFEASASLAQERGSFKNWSKSIYAPDTPMRNATRTSIAPTGTISIIADTSSSIEPLFALAFRRENVLNHETLFEVNQLLLDSLEKEGLKNKAVIENILAEGNLQASPKIPRRIKKLFQTSLQLPYDVHIKHQLAFQKYTDNAVSKTINLAKDATVDDVAQAYQKAWESGAKGITIYRYGSKEKQVLNTGRQPERGSTFHEAACKVCIT